jgi:ATP-binding cassette subfamily B protein
MSILAVIMAARYFGLQLSPANYHSIDGEKIPSAISLCAWANESGLWSKPVRLRGRHLFRLPDGSPVVLLFKDGGAGLMTGVQPDENAVLLQNPFLPPGSPAVSVDELRLAQVWSGEAILLRAKRGIGQWDAPLTVNNSFDISTTSFQLAGGDP